MDPDAAAVILQANSGNCDACGLPLADEKTALDHDHATGRPRGLIHSRCNSALGMIRDDVDVALGLAAYLASATLDLRELCVRA